MGMLDGLPLESVPYRSSRSSRSLDLPRAEHGVVQAYSDTATRMSLACLLNRSENLERKCVTRCGVYHPAPAVS